MACAASPPGRLVLRGEGELPRRTFQLQAILPLRQPYGKPFSLQLAPAASQTAARAPARGRLGPWPPRGYPSQRSAPGVVSASRRARVASVSAACLGEAKPTRGGFDGRDHRHVRDELRRQIVERLAAAKHTAPLSRRLVRDAAAACGVGERDPSGSGTTGRPLHHFYRYDRSAGAAPRSWAPTAKVPPNQTESDPT